MRVNFDPGKAKGTHVETQAYESEILLFGNFKFVLAITNKFSVIKWKKQTFGFSSL